MRHSATALLIGSLLCVSMIAMPPVQGEGTVVVVAPTALDYTCEKYANVSVVQYPSTAMEILETPTAFAILQASYAGPDEWVATGLYNSTEYYGDPMVFPPSNSTIGDVYLYAYACIDTITSSRTFYMQYAINESKSTIDAGTAIWHGGAAAWSNIKTATNVYPTFLAFAIDITTNESWNASMLRDNIWVRLYSDDHGSTKLYVDYVGLYYTWTYDEEPPEGGEDPVGSFGLADFTIVSAFGMVGFIGLIALPPVAIWMWRNEGGSRLRAFVTLLIAGMFCFVLFYVSIMGA